MPEMAKLFSCAAARGLDLAFVSVLITGTLTTANVPASLGISTGDKVTMSFLTLPTAMDRVANDGSGVHVMDGIGAFPICNETFKLAVGDSGMKAVMGPAPPATELVPLVSTDTFLSVVSKRPVNDGMWISPSATVPKSVPLKMSGIEGLYGPSWDLDFNAVYKRGTIPSMHMKQLSAQTYGGHEVKQVFTLSTGFATNNVFEANIDSIEFEMPKEALK